jgi:hypothetical protein
MKEFELFFKTFSECLRLAAKGFESVAKMVDEFAVTQAESKPSQEEGRETKVVDVSTAAPPRDQRVPSGMREEIVAPPKAPVQEPAGVTATDAVFSIIEHSKDGVGTAAIKTQTGFKDKKIHNIIYKLKKQGKIKSKKKGVYVRA